MVEERVWSIYSACITEEYPIDIVERLALASKVVSQSH